jgi:hypothetical protein
MQAHGNRHCHIISFPLDGYVKILGIPQHQCAQMVTSGSSNAKPPKACKFSVHKQIQAGVLQWFLSRSLGIYFQILFQ